MEVTFPIRSVSTALPIPRGIATRAADGSPRTVQWRDLGKVGRQVNVGTDTKPSAVALDATLVEKLDRTLVSPAVVQWDGERGYLLRLVVAEGSVFGLFQLDAAGVAAMNRAETDGRGLSISIANGEADTVKISAAPVALAPIANAKAGAIAMSRSENSATAITVTVNGAKMSVPVPPIPPGLPSTVGGEPITYSWKAMIAPGSYKHPHTGQAFAFSRDDVLDMAATHRRLRDETGFTPYIPTKHKGGANVGRVVDVKAVNGVLLGLHQLIGDDARKLAARSQSSVYVHPTWQDQHGRTWRNVIEHNALVADPLMSGLGGFALSRDAGAGTEADELNAIESRARAFLSK